jgi:hypothetical protein
MPERELQTSDDRTHRFESARRGTLADFVVAESWVIGAVGLTTNRRPPSRREPEPRSDHWLSQMPIDKSLIWTRATNCGPSLETGVGFRKRDFHHLCQRVGIGFLTVLA